MIRTKKTLTKIKRGGCRRARSERVLDMSTLRVSPAAFDPAIRGSSSDSRWGTCGLRPTCLCR
jgi:hypothetical protein